MAATADGYEHETRVTDPAKQQLERGILRRPAKLTRAIAYPAFAQTGPNEPLPGTQAIFLYLRLSKYHKDSHDAIERQRLDLTRKLLSDGGWTVLGEYIDNDSASSSAIRTRKGWHALNTDIEAGRVRAVAFWKLDRTNRVAAKCIEWIGTCQARGVELVSHQDSSDELNTATAGAKLMTGIKALLAEVETDTMSERQKAAKRHCAEAGFHHGGTRPFGWVPGPRVTDEFGRSGVRLIPQPIEFQALQDAVKMVLGGASLMAVSRYWRDAHGITTALGAPMYEESVRRALISPRMIGFRMRQVPEHRRGVKVQLLDYIARDAQGEPVISQEAVCDRLTWMRLVQILEEASTSDTRQPWGSHAWLLTGLLYCQCGNRLYGFMTSHKRVDGSKVTNYVYRCTANRLKGAGACTGGCSVPAQKAEVFVEGWLFAYLSDERLAVARAQQAEKRLLTPHGRIIGDLEEARAERDVLISQQGTNAYRGAMVGVLVGLIAAVQARVDTFERQLDALVLDAHPIASQNALVTKWPNMTLGERRRLLGRVVERIDSVQGRAPMRDRLTVKPRL
ncbi:MAG: recombinase family protein [Mycobacteriales bacterium]